VRTTTVLNLLLNENSTTTPHPLNMLNYTQPSSAKNVQVGALDGLMKLLSVDLLPPSIITSGKGSISFFP
jgi:hypothetical protein